MGARRALVVQSRLGVAGALRAVLADAAVEAWPALDGWYVLAEVGGLAPRPFIVVRGDPADASRAIALGADAWVDDDVHVVAAAGKLVASIAA